jgi:hypothetical protein
MQHMYRSLPAPVAGDFTSVLTGIDTLYQDSAPDSIDCYEFGSGTAYPTGLVPYYVYQPPGGPTEVQSQQALGDNYARNFTPALPPHAAYSGVRVQKRHGRPNIDPRTWAIDDELKDAWRLHITTPDEGAPDEKDEEEQQWLGDWLCCFRFRFAFVCLG